ncbi:MAG: CoA pyrophosphatase [Betaproteobacteria bacterium HGW-Betaproteobacteria-18]|nr:MAG: CoA pyrophosphatase [Betaproteobacteria bacterium HGW-Betaproteobacteria-18]
MTPPRIDPRTVPVTQVDTHLPAVHGTVLQPDALRARFAKSPVWQAEFLAEKKFMDRAPMPAAVLLPIVLRPEPTVLLTLRAQHLSTHSGQIAFPGGKVDDTDADAVAAALREAQEEIGLGAHFVEVLGQLPIYVTGSAFHVTPVVALISPDMVLRPNPFEVADVFEVPLAYLMNPAHHRHHRVDWQGVQREWLSMPYQDATTERFIWGATAGMLRNFYRFLQA